ncbi:MAG: pentapeptide repeat-containing protein [Chlorobium sp.]
MKKTFLNNRDHWKIIGIVIALLVFIGLVAYGLQIIAESDVYITPPSQQKSALKNIKEQYEIAKIYSEIRQIRSDTGGSLFWLKLIALFVTVGGAVGGYLIGQSRATRSRLEFEDRKSVDTAYQTILQELSAEPPLLRAAAGAKLGLILKFFPEEWNVNENRKNQLIDLTKNILATSLSIEKDKSVLKNLTKAVVLHHSVESDSNSDKWDIGNCASLDFSNVKASDAYWAKTDFSNADFFCADLEKVSFRNSVLIKAQFRESILQNAVFINADCQNANFKSADCRNVDFSLANCQYADFTLTDIRNSNFSGAKLTGALFDRAKVFGVIISSETVFSDNPDKEVDNSENGDGSEMIVFKDWLSLKINELEKTS